MMKTFTTLTAAATLAVALAAAPTDANAQRRWGWGPAIGLGILGGVAAGAIIGGAIANSRMVRPMWFSRATCLTRLTGGPPVGCPGGYWARGRSYDQ